MRTGRPIAPLSLTVEERETLGRWARRPKSAQALAQRSRIVLECAAGQANTVVARKLGLTHQTVGKWRQRFVARRLDGLLDEPRPGAPRQVGDAQIERVVRLTLESTPAAGDPLEHACDGQAQWVESINDQPHLAGICVATAPGGGLQAL
jgi:hypothetical protein